MDPFWKGIIEGLANIWFRITPLNGLPKFFAGYFLTIQSVLPTEPIFRKSADFQGLTADKNFGEIGCRFLVLKMPILPIFRHQISMILADF